MISKNVILKHLSLLEESILFRNYFTAAIIANEKRKSLQKQIWVPVAY